MCYHAEFGRSALKDVGINTGEPQNWGALELHFLGMGGVADPNIHAPPHMCYLAELGRSALEGVVIHRKESPKLGSARLRLFGWGVANP